MPSPLASQPRTFAQAPPSTDPRFARDRFFLKQKLLSINENYKVHGDGDEVLLHVRRPAKILQNLMATGVAVVGILVAVMVGVGVGFTVPGIAGVIAGLVVGLALGAAAMIAAIVLSPLRELLFCRDERLSDLVLHVSQDGKFQFPYAVFTLRDSNQAVLCTFRKHVLWDILRRRWTVESVDGMQRWLVQEDSWMFALLRRFAPDLIAVFLRTNFIFTTSDGKKLGEFNRKLSFRDSYVLDMTADPQRSFDRRIAVAMGVLLDTGERR